MTVRYKKLPFNCFFGDHHGEFIRFPPPLSVGCKEDHISHGDHMEKEADLENAEPVLNRVLVAAA